MGDLGNNSILYTLSEYNAKDKRGNHLMLNRIDSVTAFWEVWLRSAVMTVVT